MQPETIDRFFKLLNEKLQRSAEVIIIGASAGSLMGHIRPSMDIDFEIRINDQKPYDPIELKSLITEVTNKVGVAAQYSEDVSRWSMIDFLNYRETAIPYKKFGKLNVKLIAPPYWTIGKMARYFALDISDVSVIIRDKKISPQLMINTWRRARDSSNLSIEVGQFQDHVINFLQSRGREVWGKDFDPEKAVSEFKKRK